MAVTELQKIEAIQTLGKKLSVYRPLPAADAFHRAEAKNRFIFGGNRSGKSESNVGWDCASFALGIHDYRTTPRNAVIWVATETWEMVGKILWEEKLQQYIPPFQIAQIIWHNKGANIPKEIRLKNGNTIELKAYQQGREIFQGRSIDACYCDEQLPHDVFIEIQARLLDRNGFFTLSATPIKPQPWLEARIDSALDNDAVFYANLNDNRRTRGGYIDDNEIEAMINEWPEEVQATRVEGRFASFYGAVYKTFDRAVHVVEPFDVPHDWYHFRSIDFGFNNPFVCLWGARNNDNQWFIYAEHYRPQELIKWHAEQITHKTNGAVIRATYADHDAQGRAELRQHGIRTRAARKEVNDGIEKVQQALKVQANGQPRLFIFKTCENLTREMSSYRYPEGTDTRDPKDEPMKLNDHTCDALRYMIYTTERKGVGVSF